ncbi:16S rRNA (guanine(527)-N(7))-methyltransferase RsmG [Paracoccus sp. PAMC 22219]|uniref:16S rRNA (guanine(527)-N(7))-methyltransferase RsmG n=1 Tax=Paracoccus sp. PAMC 22219 TaxID=1569209 RepID=UPI0009E0850B|nr:16S rRNA (guanine(527)-N(7))-methyltransferase RsmG [Paracoccus sp. PAMC 22219]
MMDVSRETLEKLSSYQSLVEKWNTKINLVSPTTIPHFASRHVADSVQILDHLDDLSGHWADLGSGGGLPGVVVAIMAGDELKVTLVESDLRKSAFLRTVIRELSLHNTSVISERIEQLQPLEANYISARALAPLSVLLSMVDRHMLSDGTALLMKGRAWESECADARKHWQFDLRSFQSKTDPEAAILKISGVSHA